jgi:hypothetical protein
MRHIAHRGNLRGPNSAKENSPLAIDQALAQGFDVEVDIRLVNKVFWLGHDYGEYAVSWHWLVTRANHLWLHCNNLRALHFFVSEATTFNYFLHEHYQYALTSHGFIWTCLSDVITSKTVLVMPEQTMTRKAIRELSSTCCYGVCSDCLLYA